MKQNDQNSINMWRVVIRYLDDRSPVWSGNSFFSNAKAELTDALRDLESTFQHQTASTLGLTKGKDFLERQAVKEVFSIAKVLRAYALHTGDQPLAAAADFSKTRLLKLPDAELLIHLRNILQAAQPVSETLKELGLDSLEPAAAAIEAYSRSIAEPRTAISGRATATAQVPQIIKQGRIALEKLDNLVHLFDAKSPGFSNGYKPCRVTVDLGHRKAEKP